MKNCKCEAGLVKMNENFKAIVYTGTKPKRVTIPGVERYKCQRCGEMVFSESGLLAIDAFIVEERSVVGR